MIYYRIILAFNSGNISTLLVHIQCFPSSKKKRAGFLDSASLLFIVISYCILHVRTYKNINIWLVLNRHLQILLWIRLLTIWIFYRFRTIVNIAFCCCFCISFLNISTMGNEKATSCGRTRKDPTTKTRWSLKEIDTKNCPHRVMILPSPLLSHLQHQQKNLEYNLRLKCLMKLSKIFLKYLQEMDMFLIVVHDVDIEISWRVTFLTCFLFPGGMSWLLYKISNVGKNSRGVKLMSHWQDIALWIQTNGMIFTCVYTVDFKPNDMCHFHPSF